MSAVSRLSNGSLRRQGDNFRRRLLTLLLYRDKKAVPSNADPIPYAQLWKSNQYGSAETIMSLAENIDPHAGEIDVVIPETYTPDSGDVYFIIRKYC